MKSLSKKCILILMLLFVPMMMSAREINLPGDEYTYIFGEYGEGLVEVKHGGETIIDLGTKPAWFMLTYMHQYTDLGSGNLVTKAKYYYPRSGEGHTNQLDLFDYNGPYGKIVRYRYKFDDGVLSQYPEQDNPSEKISRPVAVEIVE